ncbi:hypothetical protein O181_024360 [Austropuccinia psidii MF-1]|uniref:Uncharacterized protein n=1 Tax=Austropuccinia psidii MF-1 TaxID=1389203 RepID=A0A9Q3H019_9BASI|nr:hypothetical protein [Austropuccinia psidii MF-1]
MTFNDIDWPAIHFSTSLVAIFGLFLFSYEFGEVFLLSFFSHQIEVCSLDICYLNATTKGLETTINLQVLLRVCKTIGRLRKASLRSSSSPDIYLLIQLASLVTFLSLSMAEAPSDQHVGTREQRLIDPHHEIIERHGVGVKGEDENVKYYCMRNFPRC